MKLIFHVRYLLEGWFFITYLSVSAQSVKKTLQRYKELQDIIAILGLDELSEEDRLVVSRGATRNYNFW